MIDDAELDALRARFPALQQSINDKPLIYLDNAATTQKPESVLAAWKATGPGWQTRMAELLGERAP